MEVEETPEYDEEPEQEEEEATDDAGDEFSIPEECADAYPKFIDGVLEKCPRDRDNYKLGF